MADFASLMVLCPFVFLLMRYDTPPLDLQPTEVHSAHWVSLASLLSPSLRTSERADVSDRTHRSKSPIAKLWTKLVVGQMIFSAVQLKPSESTICRNPPATNSAGERSFSSFSGSLQAFSFLSLSSRDPLRAEPPLLLWGLTLGIMADLLEGIDSDGTARLWSWPTFSHSDIRLWVWLLTRNFRSQRLHELKVCSGSDSNSSSAQVGGLDATAFTTSVRGRGKSMEIGIAGAHLLDGYFEQMRKAVSFALSVRLGVGILAIATLVRNFSPRRRR